MKANPPLPDVGVATEVVDLAAQQQAALDLVDRGMHVFDLDHPSLPECIGRHKPDKPCDGERGKHPCPFSWSKGSTNVVPTVARRFGSAPRNIAVDCGRSGLVVLDEDEPGALDRFCADRGVELPETLVVGTGRGRHVYLRQPEGLPFGNGDAKLRAYGINVRGRGGYVVAPGSVHATGRRYEITTDVPIADAPDWLGEVLNPLRSPAPGPRRMPGGRCRAQVTGVLRKVLEAPEGNRNNVLFWAGCRLFEHVAVGNLGQTSAEAMLLDAALAVGLPTGEAEWSIESARKRVLGG